MMECNGQTCANTALSIFIFALSSRDMGCATSSPYEPTEAELEAERHEELIAEVAQRYELQFAPLRAEIGKAKEAYHSELADETNKRIGRLSTPTRKKIDSSKHSLDELEARYAQLRQQMQDELASLRDTQRTASLERRHWTRGEPRSV